jgi:hypothetical protein
MFGNAEERSQEPQGNIRDLMANVDSMTGGVPHSSKRVCLHRHRVVLVNEAAEHVVATDSVSPGSGADLVVGDRHVELDASMRALPVGKADIFTKNSFEVALAKDGQPIEAFGADRPCPALRVGVRPWQSEGCLDAADSLGAEHLVERRADEEYVA